MRILIVGCGYVGSAAAHLWKQKGHQVWATSRSPEKLTVLQTWVDRVFLADAIFPELKNVDAVLLSVAADDLNVYEETYLKTAERIIFHLPLKTPLLYTGSTSVYGDHEGNWVTEDSPLFPFTSQATILVKTEQTLIEKGHPVTLFRLSEIYGPQRMWNEKIRRLSGKTLAGNGLQYTNTIHRDDIISALDFALQNQLTGIYNLSDDTHLPRKELYFQLCQEMDLPPVQWDPTLVSVHGGNKRISNQKIKNAGFVFQYPHLLVKKD